MHAIIIPFPAQGHVTPLLQLALTLLRGGCPFTHVTFVNTQFNHDLIAANGRSQALFATPGLNLLCVPDGLPPGHARLTDPRVFEFGDAIDAMDDVLRQLIADLVSLSEPPVSCIIADILLYWMPDIADAVGLPYAAFWTNPVHATLAYTSMSDLVSRGILPVNGMRRESTQRLVDCIPGLPPLKACDLPSFLQTTDGSPDDFFFRWALKRYGAGVPQRATWHLTNTTTDLDPEGTSLLRVSLGSDFWPVGPLLPPEFFSGQMQAAPQTGSGFWADTTGCKEWLDKQEDGSVLYISFGSIVHFEPRQVKELAAGVEASGRPYLWVLRLDVDAETRVELDEFAERTRHKGFVVSWAPQLLVLSHRSTGAFLSHCGWNSVMEAICGGIPLLAWPACFAEQVMNAIYIIEVWKFGIGFQAELIEEGLPLVKKEEIERAISQVLDVSYEQSRALKERALLLQKKVRDAVLTPEGSSQINLNSFAAAVSKYRPR